MPNHPRLDRTSLARIGLELQAAHHRSEKEPLSADQRDLLLQWAVKEALEAAQDQALGASEPGHGLALPCSQSTRHSRRSRLRQLRRKILVAIRSCFCCTPPSREAGTQASGRMGDGAHLSELMWSFGRPTGCRL
jgi:hypothetical protein